MALIGTIFTPGSDFDLAVLESTLVGWERRLGLNESTQSNIAIGATTDLTVQPERMVVQLATGAATVTSWGTPVAGLFWLVRCAGTITVAHNGTTMLVNGNTDLVAQLGDLLLVWASSGTAWRTMMVSRFAEAVIFDRAAATAVQNITHTVLGAPTTFINLDLPTSYNEFDVAITDLLPTTSAAVLNMQTSLDGTTWLSGGAEYISRLSCWDLTTAATLVSTSSTAYQLTRSLSASIHAQVNLKIRSGLNTGIKTVIGGQANYEHSTGSLGWGGASISGRNATNGRATRIRLFMSSGQIDAGTRVQVTGALRP